MIQLSEEQLKIFDTAKKPALVVDPRSGQEYVLIRRDIFEKAKGFLQPYGRVWEKPADTNPKPT